MQTRDLGCLIGKTMTSVEINDDRDEIRFTTTDGEVYLMFHSQDCCESVNVHDIEGDLEWLVGMPIVSAYESTDSDDPRGLVAESFTWTFYNLATAKGSVWIRWFGESNGYYSEGVDICKESDR